MTCPDAEERATEPRSLQVFDRVPRLIGLRDLIGEKFAGDARPLTKSLLVTSFKRSRIPRVQSSTREARRDIALISKRASPSARFCSIIERYD